MHRLIGPALSLVCLLAGNAHAQSPTSSTGDVTASPECRALAVEMSRAVRKQPLDLAQNGERRAAGAAMSIAAAAAPKLLAGVGGGVAGGLAAEFLRAAESEAKARAEEAQLNAINALSEMVEALDDKMTAAGCDHP